MIQWLFKRQLRKCTLHQYQWCLEHQVRAGVIGRVIIWIYLVNKARKYDNPDPWSQNKIFRFLLLYIENLCVGSERNNTHHLGLCGISKGLSHRSVDKEHNCSCLFIPLMNLQSDFNVKHRADSFPSRRKHRRRRLNQFKPAFFVPLRFHHDAFVDGVHLPPLSFLSADSYNLLFSSFIRPFLFQYDRERHCHSDSSL